MEAWMIVTALIVVVLPFVLMWLFNGPDRADSRGRRIRHSWRVTRRA